MILVDDTLCTGCKRCEKACPNSAIRVNPVSKKAEINNNLCSECGMCIEECPKNALSFPSQQNSNIHNSDDYRPYAKGNIYAEVSNRNIPSHLQTPAFGKRGGSGMGRHQGKGHRRGWFHKKGK
jgi:formate hydrogenlyase subunit 6/NADH:ubiquinone oxidoreductase subunit I